MTATATDNRKQRDVVASDIDNDRVVDERGNPVGNVELQKTLPESTMFCWALQKVSEASTVSNDCLNPTTPATGTKSELPLSRAIV